LSYERYGAGCDRSHLQEAALRAVQRLTGAAEGRTFVARCGERMAGAACWGRLTWDSELFGFPAARLHFLLASAPGLEGQIVQAALCETLLDDARHSGIRHLTARVDAGDLGTIQVLEASGFRLLDGLQTFSLALRGAGFSPPGALAPLPTGRAEPRPQPKRLPHGLVRGFQSEDLDPVCAIARSVYVLDRFHADTALAPGVADRLHETWVRNSCLGQAADHVVIAETNGLVAGFVTCKLDQEATAVLGGPLGTIVLVATAAAARGQGVARAATRGALDWFGGQGAALVEVGTQLRNIPAGRLYESCGFRLLGVSLTLRRIL
jgi:ribosomal protein S18 acetylase RimI-like enzyme